MVGSIELQMISKILTSDDESVVNSLCQYDESYYSVLREHIEFILNHRQTYGDIPDVFTFQAQFPDLTLIRVDEPISYLTREIKKNKEHIILVDTMNKLKDLGASDVSEAWQYLSAQCERIAQMDDSDPLDIVHDAKFRSEQILDFSRQSRIPTGFAEIDKLMYGGLSTVEELLLLVARTNSGKSWICTKMLESAQGNGFPVLYYSPEMQASYLGTRFDTWRSHFPNNKIYKGEYSEQYYEYLDELSKESTSAFILEDKDVEDGNVNIRALENIIKKHHIRLLIVDGLSYMTDIRKSDTEYVRYKNICLDLFKLSKKYGCAVVVALQANRETRDSKDDKGEPFPTIYQIEGSDHPARIATQVFAIRQIFDKHVLDIRLEKSRMANNQKPVLSYAWDVNTGNMQYLPGDDVDISMTTTVKPDVSMNLMTHKSSDDKILEEELNFDEDIEF